MNNLYKDILTGTLFITGLVGFISGEFIMSSALFAVATVTSNLKTPRKDSDAGRLSCN